MLIEYKKTQIHSIWVFNYCIRKINQGELHYYKDALDLYKAGLSTAVLLEQGNLSRFTYFNIVAAGINSGDLNWVEDFIEQYRQNLEKQQRHSAYSFNLARLQFARKNYQAVLELLQQANYRDVLVTLAIKTLLLKTFYELDEYDLLLSHLDAMQNYIRRKRVLGYHRTNYLNIIRYTNKLLQLSPGHHQEREQLVLVIRAEVHLTEKEWFLEKLTRKHQG